MADSSGGGGGGSGGEGASEGAGDVTPTGEIPPDRGSGGGDTWCGSGLSGEVGECSMPESCASLGDAGSSSESRCRARVEMCWMRSLIASCANRFSCRSRLQPKIGSNVI